MRASEASVNRLHVSGILVSFTRMRSDSTDIAGVQDFWNQGPAVVPAPSLGVLHFLFFSLITGSSQ